jgi:uncharacterized protein YaeQ
MALKSIIYKADLQVSDMDRNYYGRHALTIARHPSETDERMMVRLLAFACHADEALAFGRGLSADDEPALWLKDLTGAIALWIDVGLPDEKLIRKASGRSERVMLYIYGGKVADVWYEDNRSKLAKIGNLGIVNIPAESTQKMAAMAQRTMEIQCSIQDGQIWFSAGEDTIQIELIPLQTAAE